MFQKPDDLPQHPSQTASPGSICLSTRSMVLTALITAVTCILAPLSIPIPFSPVPITLTNLVIGFSIYLLGWKKATLSYIIYLLLGLAGLPVFSGFSGGFAKFAGPTGGYLIGFIFLTIIGGLIIDHFPLLIRYILALISNGAVFYCRVSYWRHSVSGRRFCKNYSDCHSRSGALETSKCRNFLKRAAPTGQPSLCFFIVYPFTAPAATPLIICFWQDR